MPRSLTRLLLSAALGAAATLVPGAAVMPAALAQDMMQYIDLGAPDFTEAEMTRKDIIAALAALPSGKTLDLSGKRLNKLDLSGLDLTRVKFQATRINSCNFKDANLSGVVLDQAWAVKSDFTGAKFVGASLFQTQMIDAKLDRADFTNAMVGADMTRASLKQAIFDAAMLAPDLTNQSMGLMRGVLKSAKLDGASFKEANLARASLEYASLRGADFESANLEGAELAGADLTGANVTKAKLANADVNGARLVDLKGRELASGFDRLVNSDRATID